MSGRERGIHLCINLASIMPIQQRTNRVRRGLGVRWKERSETTRGREKPQPQGDFPPPRMKSTWDTNKETSAGMGGTSNLGSVGDEEGWGQ